MWRKRAVEVYKMGRTDVSLSKGLQHIYIYIYVYIYIYIYI
jgi:hypothetical protein